MPGYKDMDSPEPGPSASMVEGSPSPVASCTMRGGGYAAGKEGSGLILGLTRK